MKTFQTMQATDLLRTENGRLRLGFQAITVGAALTLLCATAHGDSALMRIAKAINGQPDQKVATAEKPTLAPGPEVIPMVPMENGATSGTLQSVPQEPTGLASDKKNGKGGNLDLGKESEESLTATDLFKKPEIRKLLGDQPRFVYNPQDRPDPMLVPWVRNAAMYAELSVMAEAAVKGGELDRAVELYERILSLKDSRYTTAVHAKLLEINSAKAEAAAKSAMSGLPLVKVELPPWVIDNTTGVIDGGGHGMALVGDDLVHVGQALPKYPEIKVASITGKKVTYELQGKTFEVELKDPEEK